MADATIHPAASPPALPSAGKAPGWLSIYVRPFALTVILLSAVCCLIGAAARPDPGWALTGLINFLTMGVLVFGLIRSRYPSLVSPIALMILVMLVSTPARYLYFSLSDPAWDIKWFLAGRDGTFFVAGALLMLIFSIAFVTAYRLRLRVPDLSALKVFDRAPTVVILTAVLPLIGIALFGLVMYMTRTGGSFADLLTFQPQRRAVLEGATRLSFGQYLEIAEWLFPIGILLIGISIRQQRLTRPLLLATGLGLVLFYAMFKFNVAVRGDIMLALIILGMVGFLRSRRVPKAALVGGAVIVAAAFTAITSGRYEHNANYAAMARDEPVMVMMDGAFGAFNLGGFIASSQTIDAIPERLDYQYGATLLEPFWVIIPRTIWPTKPRTIGMHLLEAFQGTEVMLARRGGGNSAGLAAEGFINFGWFGVPLVGFFFGLMMNLFYTTLVRGMLENGAACAIYAYATVIMVYDGFGYNFAKGFIELMVKGACLALAWGVVMIGMRLARR